MSKTDIIYANEAAERAVLGVFAARPKIAKKNIAKLMPEDFFLQPHQRLYECMRVLLMGGKQPTFPLIAQVMAEKYLDDSPMMVLLDIQQKDDLTAAEVTIGDNIRLVKGASHRRLLRTLFRDAGKSLDDPNTDPDTALSEIQRKLRENGENRAEIETLNDVLTNAYSEVEAISRGERRGMTSGIKRLDEITSGFHRGEMTILGARPSVGKSALGCQIALAAARAGCKVCIVSREMTDVQYGIRILSRGTHVKNTAIRGGKLSDDDWTELGSSMVAYGGHDVRFLFRTRYIEDLAIVVRQMKEDDGLDMLVVDYTQQMLSRKDHEKEYVRVGYVSKMLKDLSTELDIAVIALAQVGREASERLPTLAELRGSGDLEQDADNVILLHRVDEPMGRTDIDSILTDCNVEMQRTGVKVQLLLMKVAKQRQGGLGSVPCKFYPESMTYIDLEDDISDAKEKRKE